MAHVPAIQKAGMHEAARIAQAVMQREAAMAVIASAGERADRARADRLPPAARVERAGDAPDERPRPGDGGRRRRRRRPDGEEPPRHVDVTA